MHQQTRNIARFLVLCAALGFTVAHFEKSTPRTSFNSQSKKSEPIELTIRKLKKTPSTFEGWKSQQDESESIQCTIKNVSNSRINFSIEGGAFCNNLSIISSDLNLETPYICTYVPIYDSVSILPGQCKTIHKTIYRINPKNKKYPRFRMIFHPGMPSPVRFNRKEFLSDKDRSRLKTNWKQNPINQDFISNEIEF